MPAFHYNTIYDVEKETTGLGVSLPLESDLSRLAEPLAIKGHTVANRLAIQPMEGCDGREDGAPGELTLRRYRRFAESGAGLIWAEATAVLPKARANPRQLMITPDNIDVFQKMTSEIKERCQNAYGFEPIVIVQLTHSGRYSKPAGKPEPIIAYNCPPYETNGPLPESRIVSDEELDTLPELYARSAKLAEQAGFDGVDIKACHRYLICELLSAYNRPGRYGGSFENRTRLLLDAVDAVQAAVSPHTIVTSRLNIYDGAAYPYEPPENPLVGVARMADCIGEVAQAFPDLSVIASGMSYLRHLSPCFAAGMITQKGAAMAGFGREAFAYPGFAHDILEKGGMDPKKCCIACGKCTELMRMGGCAGCVIRDSAVYAPLYREGKERFT